MFLPEAQNDPTPPATHWPLTISPNEVKTETHVHIAMPAFTAALFATALFTTGSENNPNYTVKWKTKCAMNVLWSII